MTRRFTITSFAQAGWVVGSVLSLLASGCGNPPPPAKPAAKPAVVSTNAAPASEVSTNVPSEYVSVFEDIPSPKGKDPFFPASHRRDPVIAAPVNETGTPAVRPEANLTLKAVIHTVKHSQAVINNEIMEKGEEASVRVPNGRIRVKCLEIGVDYVLVQVEGEAEPKRLIMEQKK